MTALRAVAAWTGPVVLTALAAGAFTGAAGAPWLVLVAVVAPLVALVGPSRDDPVGGDVALTVALTAGAAAVVAANLRVLGDAGAVLGVPPRYAVAVLAAAALVVPQWVPMARLLTGLAPLAVLTLGGALVATGMAAGVAPWAAWESVASRPALQFGQHSAWVTEGQAFVTPTTLAFTEPHRVVVLTPGVYRVVERDGPQAAVREWRLASGDALTLRPGDQLTANAGARLRFEPGTRVPGVALSGPAWAAPGPPGFGHAAVEFLGLAVTLVGGGVGLVGPAPRRGPSAVLAPATVLVAALVPAAWGVYAVFTAPDLVLGAPDVAVLLRLPGVALGAVAGGPAVTVVAGALALLHLGAAAACHARIRTATGSRSWVALGAWAAALMVATAVGLGGADAWRLFTLGLGLVAATIVAPALGTPGPWPRRAGGAVAAVVFVALAAGGAGSAPALAPLRTWPALVAAPLGWIVAQVAGGRRR